jgi:hypothetical protein
VQRTRGRGSDAGGQLVGARTGCAVAPPARKRQTGKPCRFGERLRFGESPFLVMQSGTRTTENNRSSIVPPGNEVRVLVWRRNAGSTAA